jgi:chromate transporter
VALVASAGLTIIVLAFWGEGGASINLKSIDYIAVGIFASGLFVLRKWKVNPMYVMLGQE